MQLDRHFDPGAARREVSRLHYIGLARVHFFSALIVLSALVGLGIAQNHDATRSTLGTIPTTPATLILVGLILLAVLSRIALDVAVDPLIDAISELPGEGSGIGLLRRAVEILESAAAAGSSRGPVAILPPSDRLDGVIEEDHRALLDAVRHLSATNVALGATMRSSVDALGEAMSSAQAQRPATGGGDAESHRLTELQSAVEGLTAVLKRLATSSDTAEGLLGGLDLPAHPGVQEPRLAHELRKLLQEIEGAR